MFDNVSNAFEGVIFKGVDHAFPWENFKNYLIAGRLPVFNDSLSNEVIISEYLSNRLGLKPGDSLELFFLRDNESL